VTYAFLAVERNVPAPVESGTYRPPRRMVLESLDRSQTIPLDGSTGWWRMDGAVGLEMPPVDVARVAIPGVAGSSLNDVRVLERPIFLPLFTTSPGDAETHLAMLDAFRALVDPLTGAFRIIGATDRGEREMLAVYLDGLEGATGRSESGTYWRKIGVNAVACEPFARARTNRVVEFATGASDTPFLGVVGGTDAPWPGSLGASTVIGNNMPVRVSAEVPVYPTLDLVGPMTSFAGTLTPQISDQAWSVNIPNGVPAGQTLRLVTDPRARSFRLGAGDPADTPNWSGSLAAGRVARGSTLRPFLPGLNTLSVAAPGGTEATRIRLSWRELYRSLW
jgi:hypothetical protein